MVLETGDAQADKWRYEEINVVDDYKKAFGEMPSHS
jgi:hypothetical protein